MDELKKYGLFCCRYGFGGSSRATATILSLFIVFAGCVHRRHNWLYSVKVDYYKGNFLKVKLSAETEPEVTLRCEYWDSLTNERRTSRQSTVAGKTHEIVLYNLKPNSTYHYRFIAHAVGDTLKSKAYRFKLPFLPEYMNNELFIEKSETKVLPKIFKEGLIMLHKRETPGAIYMVDYTGKITWYHRISEAGFKVSTFNRGGAILSIVGTNDDPTSYGRSILEINMLGDTTLFFKKGRGDLPRMIHHEVIRRGADEIVTLFCDNRAFDLREAGGGADTVKGDGIIVLNRNCEKTWQWSVFDEINPVEFPSINKVKDDWVHANGLMIDKDGNFIVSFYNIGQLWKIDAVSGRVLWKLGQGGTLKIGKGCAFEQSHAVHYNPRGSLMFFDNGFKKKTSSAVALKVDEKAKAVNLDFKVNLPEEMFNERMGSAYMINDSALLCACSKRHKTLLANLKGEVCWVLHSNFPSYRAQFIPGSWLGEFQPTNGDRKL